MAEGGPTDRRRAAALGAGAGIGHHPRDAGREAPREPSALRGATGGPAVRLLPPPVGGAGAA
eukprot:8266434-Lingulodinium_polyedra.AAC.1